MSPLHDREADAAIAAYDQCAFGHGINFTLLFFFQSSVSIPAKPQFSSAISWMMMWVCSGFLPRMRTRESVTSWTNWDFCALVAP